ncbi:hypothetical protein B296_00040768 [Ensete ventricosum]|uniref:Uncharacterized protein n=1 Tax=Ensete ventricosum TaxID=4639 RepID=A0A426X329_ENSVE|nr:hypothetical protein B296_00040768 [Ensete ventricosum]
MGSLPACPGWFNRLVSRVQAVYPSPLGGLPTGNCWLSPYFQGTGGPTIANRWFTFRNLRKSGSLYFSNFGFT